MRWSLTALVLGFVMDLIFGDPRSIPHPVIFMGKIISFLDKNLRKLFPKTNFGEKILGIFLWVIVVFVSTVVPVAVLFAAQKISPWLRLVVESIMCWQCLATKSLKNESMKVYYAFEEGDEKKARREVSMIVGRDTEKLDSDGIIRATVETVAENTSDGIVAPLIFMALGGGAGGFFYKAINTMDSMLGYIEPPYKNVGMFAAKADDAANFLPSRISAAIMLISGAVLGLDVKNGIKIFRRDRFNHSSPNSAQTEAVAAGLLGIRLGGDAYYHGVLHKKKYIGDKIRNVECFDIPLVCRISYLTSVLTFVVVCTIKILILSR